MIEPDGPGRPDAELIPVAFSGERVDRVVAMVTGCSRSEASAAIETGTVLLDDHVVLKASERVAAGQELRVLADPVRVEEPVAADPDVEVEVLYADDDIIVVDKAAGLVVHPGSGNRSGTLVHGLLARYPELSDVGEPHRPGLVHRLDRGTSGLLVVARNAAAHASLVEQLASHSVHRVYTALAWGRPEHPAGVIDAPIGRSRRDPLRMTVALDGRDARTHYRVEQQFHDPVEVALLTCELETGRTHQIRVHLGSVGHPVVGDEVYGPRRDSFVVPRTFLHARHLEFTHPGTGAAVEYESPLPGDLVDVLTRLG